MPTPRIQMLFKPDFRFGLGGVTLGNEFNTIPDRDAEAALEAAWSAGVRYYDTAPWYGLGLSERRFGRLLASKPRGEFLLSSKVGKLLKATKGRTTDLMPHSNSPNKVVFDYTADGVRRSVEDSLQRLGVDSLDVVFVHDISPDFPFFPKPWEHFYDEARRGAFPALSKMRDEGLIQAWGVGVNCPEPILKVIADADPDVCLCARQYSLIDHANAVEEVFPAVLEKGVGLVMGSSLNAGFVSGSPRYNYGPKNHEIPPEIIDRRDRYRALADRHGTDLRVAALLFAQAAEPAVSLIVGAGSAQQVLEDYNAVQAKVPTAFWAEARDLGLIHPDAKTPN